ncbi:hypothetical protein PBAC_26380 [Pedobacter glucosidilyticus]|nr:hypothetical protein PBAC_26380 [Pedobacter glucosidilyticus]
MTRQDISNIVNRFVQNECGLLTEKLLGESMPAANRVDGSTRNLKECASHTIVSR